MQIIRDILIRQGIQSPDGRPLFAYECRDDERACLAHDLRFRVGSGQVLDKTAMGFALWAAEHIRTRYPGGHLTWKFVFKGLDLLYDRDTAVSLTECGLLLWRRPLRCAEGGQRLFLYSLMAEGGLPDVALAEANCYSKTLLGLIGEIEAEGALGPGSAQLIAQRRIGDLPQAFRNEDNARLLADLATELVDLRRDLPQDLSAAAAERWLDHTNPDWRQRLPLQLSPRALERLIRPALTQAHAHLRSDGPPVRRELRLRADGNGWAGVAIVQNGALVPQALLPDVDLQLRLRFLTDTGASFLGVPEEGGWRLQNSVSRPRFTLPLAPDEAVVLSAHADGRLLGDAVLDAGMPSPDESPLLWRAAVPGAAEPEALVPLSGQGRTRGNTVWVLASDGSVPEPEIGAEIKINTPIIGPGGKLWPLSGKGAIKIGDDRLFIATRSETEEAEARLMVIGALLPGWKAQAGIMVFRGEPKLWGARSEALLRQLKKEVLLTKAGRLLSERLVEWRENDVPLARLRIVVLPDNFKVTLRETNTGTLSLVVIGLKPCWHVALLSGTNEAHCCAGPDGGAVFQLKISGRLPGSVILRLSDPASGDSLAIIAPWPAPFGMILDPNGKRLENNRQITISRLGGWRGILPPKSGTVQMTIAEHGAAVGFQSTGEIHLAAFGPMIRQSLSLSGPDAKLRLRLIAGGRESPRLEIGSYDWSVQPIGPNCDMGNDTVCLNAVSLDGTAGPKEIKAKDVLNLSEWLDDGHSEYLAPLYFIQGHSATRGVMRPFAWSSEPMPPSTREDRVANYQGEWQRLLNAPDDPGWPRVWTLIRTTRTGGDASGLDQVQALGRVPAAAVVLMMRASKDELADAAALEESAPISWSMLSCYAWQQGVQTALAWQKARFVDIGFVGDEVTKEAADNLARRAGRILALRPDLKVHLGQAYRSSGLLPLAFGTDGKPVPLAVPDPKAQLETLMQEAAKRFDRLPDGTGHIHALHLNLGKKMNPQLRPLLDAPLVVAEIAADLRPMLEIDKILQLFALRLADPIWFDAAIPPALTLALEVSR